MIQIDRRGSFKNFLNNVPLMISFCAYVCLTVTSIGKVVFALAGGVVLLFASFHIEMNHESIKRNTPKGSVVSAAAVALLLILSGAGFYSNMIYSSKIKSVAAMLGVSNLTIVLLLTCVAVVAASYFCFWMVGIIQLDGGELQLKAVVESSYLKNAATAISFLGLVLAIMCSFNGSIWADEAYS